MKNWIAVGVLMVLTACGGGSGPGPIPAPKPTLAPQSIQLHFVGGVKGGTIIKDAVRFTRATTNDNVELASPDATPDPSGAFSLSTVDTTGATDGILQVISTPSPSAPPTITDSSSTASVVSTPTPVPNATPVTTIPTVKISETVPNVTEAKIISVTVNGVTTTTNQWVWKSATVTCNSGPQRIVSAENQSALSFDVNGNASPAADIASADLYLTGQACQGVFNDSGPYTLHLPGGAKVYAGTQLFDALNANDWANVTTAVNLYDFVNGSGVFQFKTRSGITVKVLPGSANYSNPAGFGFQFAETGKSPDGY